MQVIIYQNPQADNVCVCVPTGEISIQEVLGKDCPSGARIVDSSSLPDDNLYFDAWRLVDDVVVVDTEAARQIATNNLNAWARQEYLKRAADEAIGIQLAVSNEDFSAVIQEGRDKIAAAKTTAQMTEIVIDTEEKAKDAPLE